jgi:hypothetical protein
MGEGEKTKRDKKALFSALFLPWFRTLLQPRRSSDAFRFFWGGGVGLLLTCSIIYICVCLYVYVNTSIYRLSSVFRLSLQPRRSSDAFFWGGVTIEMYYLYMCVFMYLFMYTHPSTHIYKKRGKEGEGQLSIPSLPLCDHYAHTKTEGQTHTHTHTHTHKRLTAGGRRGQRPWHDEGGSYCCCLLLSPPFPSRPLPPNTATATAATNTPSQQQKRGPTMLTTGGGGRGDDYYSPLSDAACG